MTTKILNKLGYLASEKLQVRCAVGGTSESYVVLDQLVEDASSFLRDPLTLGSGLDTSGLRSALEALEINDEMSNETIVNSNKSWARLRSEARRLLDASKVDLAAFEAAILAEERCDT